MAAGFAVLLAATLMPRTAGDGDGASTPPLTRALSVAEAAAAVSFAAEVGPASSTPIMPVAQPLAAIDALTAPASALGPSAADSLEAKRAAQALLYAPSDVSWPLEPDAIEPVPNAGILADRPAGEVDMAGPGPKDIPIPASVAPADIVAAKLAIGAYRKGDMAEGDAAAATVTGEVGRVALQWAAIKLDPRGLGFGRIIAFLNDHPQWPSARWLSDRAEGALYADRGDYALLASYFAKSSPETGLGKLALARLLRKQGEDGQAASLAREVWRNDDFTLSLEAQDPRRVRRPPDRSRP